MGLRGGGMAAQDPASEFARKRMMALLGAGLMSNPSPTGIGPSIGNAVVGSLDARREWEERQRALALERQREEDRRWQLSERQRLLQERTQGDQAAQSEAQRIAEARARLREAGDANADFYSPKQVDEQYVKRFGYDEPDEVNWQIREGGDGRVYQINPKTGEARAVEGVPAQVDEPDEVNWQTQVGGDGKVYQVHPRTGAVRTVEGVPPKTATRSEMSRSERERIAVSNAKATYDEAMAAWKTSGADPDKRPRWANHYNREADRLGLPLLPGDTYMFPGEARARGVTPPRRSTGIGASALPGGAYEFDAQGNLVRRD